MTPTEELQKMIDRLDEEFKKENGYYQGKAEPYTFAMRVAKVAYAMGISKGKREEMLGLTSKKQEPNPYHIDYKRQTKLNFKENENRS